MLPFRRDAACPELVVTESTALLSASSTLGDGDHCASMNARNPNCPEPSAAPSTRSRSLFRQLSKRMRQLVDEHVGTIGMLGSVSIAVNSLTGPAMLNLPATFARSGVVPTLCTLIFVCVLSALCCLHMSNAISKVPGNAHFGKEIEYSDVFEWFWGRKWFLVTQGLFFGCITCLNISSIVDVAQVIDTVCGHWARTAALEISHSHVRWISWDYATCTPEQVQDGLCLPFSSDTRNGVVITLGNIVASAAIIPLALLDLKENAWWQVGGFVVLLITSLQFIVQFYTSGLSFDNTSWWGTNWDDLFGVVVFNFALVIVIPAWLYEREPHVQVAQVVHFSSILSTVLYIAVGLLGCLAIPHVSDNMLESMMSGAFGTWMQLGSSVFALAIIGLGSPLFSVLARLNLKGSGLCSQRQANFLAVYFPHVVSWLLNDGGAITSLLGWGGIVFTALVAFILPILLAIYAVLESDDKGSIDVYSGWVTSRRAELKSLHVLLVVTVIAVALAIFGNLTDGLDDMDTMTRLDQEARSGHGH